MLTPSFNMIHVNGRIENFFGYGNLESNIWLVGMEDGLSINGLLRYLHIRFDRTCCNSVIDIEHDMAGVLDHLKWYVPNPARPGWVPLQKGTFQHLIRLIMNFHNTHPNLPHLTPNDIRDFQRTELGRAGGNNAILELMPLPSNSTNAEDWVYDYLFPGDHRFVNRTVYETDVMPQRIDSLISLINSYKPKVVIFYGAGHDYAWNQIIGEGNSFTDIVLNDQHGFLYTDIQLKHFFNAAIGVNYFQINHPEGVRIPGTGAKEYLYNQLGQEIRIRV